MRRLTVRIGEENVIPQVDTVPGIKLPRGVKNEIDRKYRLLCIRRGWVQSDFTDGVNYRSSRRAAND